MIADDIATFIAERRATTWTAATTESRVYSFTRFQSWLRQRGIRRWPSLTADHIDEFMRSLAADGLALTTRNDYHWHVRTLTAWLVERGKLLSDPARHLEPIIAHGDETLPPPPVSEADMARLFALLPRRNVIDLRNRLHVELCYSAGLRLQESINLDVSDLDLDARTVLVRHGKNDKDRVVPLVKGALHAASEYLALRRDLVRGPDTGALFLSSRGGRRLAIKVLGRLLRHVAKVLGVRVHPHLLRHSIAVHLLRGGTDVRTIQAFLGHSHLDTTKIYLRCAPGHLRQDYDQAMPIFALDAPTDDPAVILA